jgi:C1A family cysteine protease
MIYQIAFFAAAFSSDALLSKFESWKDQHAKTYESAEALSKAMKAFGENEEIINTHNAKGLSYTLGHNEFSDLTWEEFQGHHMGELYTNRAPKNMNRKHLTGMSDNVPADSVDWVTAGAVTPVKNQQRCGSCWAFSTTGAVEGAYEVASGKLVSLSEQDLVSCDTNGDHGCKGGLMDNAFEWIEKNGLCAETDYPYSSGGGSSGTCKHTCSPVVTVTGFKDVPAKDEDALKSAVSKQPVSIAIEADKSAFQLYKSGVLDSTSCGTNLDHGVLLVGYGTDSSSGKDYWKVKNSWGGTWGESGYLRMVRGKNMCGLAMSASYPTGAKAAGPSPPSPSPSPPSPGPPAASTHYSDPKTGCLTDETEITIQGVDGDFCTPKCGLFKRCPTDMPTGVTAAPQCALQDASTHQGYCALICSPSAEIKDQKAADAQCGTNASCKPISGLGICTYDD